jgi:hypothetical protein
VLGAVTSKLHQLYDAAVIKRGPALSPPKNTWDINLPQIRARPNTKVRSSAGLHTSFVAPHRGTSWMEHSPYWEGHSSLCGQEIWRVLWKSNLSFFKDCYPLPHESTVQRRILFLNHCTTGRSVEFHLCSRRLSLRVSLCFSRCSLIIDSNGSVFGFYRGTSLSSSRVSAIAGLTKWNSPCVVVSSVVQQVTIRHVTLTALFTAFIQENWMLVSI